MPKPGHARQAGRGWSPGTDGTDDPGKPALRGELLAELAAGCSEAREAGAPGSHGSPLLPSLKAHRWGQRRSSRPRTGAPFKPRSQAGTSQVSDVPGCRPSQRERSEVTPKSFSQSGLGLLIAFPKASLQNPWPKPHQKKHPLCPQHWAGRFALPLTVWTDTEPLRCTATCAAFMTLPKSRRIPGGGL